MKKRKNINFDVNATECPSERVLAVLKEVYKKGHDKNFLLNLKHFILLTIFIKLKMQPPSHFIQF